MAAWSLDNKLFAILLIGSAALNVGLAHKVQEQRSMLYTLSGGNSEARIIGTSLTHLHAFDLNGKQTDITFTRDGNPTLLYVFRPTCGWCARNLPNLKALQSTAERQHFRLIGLSLDPQHLQEYVQSKGLTFPIYSDASPSELVRLDMGATPQTILVAHSTVVRNWGGAYTPEVKKEIESTLGVTLPGIPDPLSKHAGF